MKKNQYIGEMTLTKDPEVKYSSKEKGEKAYANLNLAQNNGHYEGEGTERTWVDEETLFLSAIAFNKRAESIANTLKKGYTILVEGTIKPETWVDKETQKNRHSVKLHINNYTLLRKPKSVA
jgi:single-strand DNA-binding protein